MPFGPLAPPDSVARRLDMSAGTFVPADRHSKIDHSIRRIDRSGGTIDPTERSSRRNDRAGGTFVPPDRSVRSERWEQTERSFRRIDPIDGSPERLDDTSDMDIFESCRAEPPVLSRADTPTDNTQREPPVLSRIDTPLSDMPGEERIFSDAEEEEPDARKGVGPQPPVKFVAWVHT